MSFISRLRRSRQHRVSIFPAYLVHPFPLRGTSPQGETRALRDWLSMSYGMISILLIGSLRSPPPIRAAPDFPLFRGQNKTPRNTLFINGSTVRTGYSATVEVLHRTSKWGEVRRLACPLRRFPFAAPPNCGRTVVAPATKGECISDARRAVVRFSCRRRRHIKLPSEPARSVG